MTAHVGIHEVHWDNKWMGFWTWTNEQTNKPNSWPGPQQNKETTRQAAKQNK